MTLYGAVLTAMVGGTIAWAATDKAVAVSIDGQTHTIHTRSATVGGALGDAKIGVAAHDAVAPATSASVHDGSRIVLRKGRLLKLRIDGKTVEVWTTATTVQEALAELGYGSGKTVSVSRSTRLPLSPTQLTLLTQKRVSIKVDGKTRVYKTTALTVGAALRQASIQVGVRDILSAPRLSPVKAGQVIVVKRVKVMAANRQQAIPYETTSTKDPSALEGTTSVVREGREGVQRTTYQLIYIDGRYVGRRVVTTVVVSPPVTRQEKVGTKTVPATPAPTPPSTPPSGGGTGPAPVGDPQAIAQQMVTARGWGGGEFQCLVNLWNRESGWNVHAANPSGAYGIPQALPGSKMGSAGPDWENNATTQISWGLGYISGVYGTPCGAWAHSENFNWY